MAMQRKIATVIYTVFLVTAGIRVYKSMSSQWKRALRRMCSGYMPLPRAFFDTLASIKEILDSMIANVYK
jgi:hypothetical protein